MSGGQKTVARSFFQIIIAQPSGSQFRTFPRQCVLCDMAVAALEGNGILLAEFSYKGFVQCGIFPHTVVKVSAPDMDFQFFPQEKQ